MSTPFGGSPQGTQPFQLGDTVERPARPVGDSPLQKQNVPVPAGPRPELLRSTVSLTEFLTGPDDEEVEEKEGGYGPRIVVLFDSARGFQRGRVLWASEFLGTVQDDKGKAVDLLAFNERAARKELRRQMDMKAIREANPDEAKVSLVKFAEPIEALEALPQVQARASAAAAEAERLAGILRSLGRDPNTGEPLPESATQPGIQQPLEAPVIPPQAVPPTVQPPVQAQQPQPTQTETRAAAPIVLPGAVSPKPPTET